MDNLDRYLSEVVRSSKEIWPRRTGTFYTPGAQLASCAARASRGLHSPPPSPLACCARKMSVGLAYHASAFEAEWFTSDADGPSWPGGKICAISGRETQRDATPHWLRFAYAFRGEQPRAPNSTEEEAVLSRFVGRDGCAEYIEPLTGLARHPWATQLGCKNRWPKTTNPRALPDKYGISHLIPANHCGDDHEQHGSQRDCNGGRVGRFGRCRRDTTLGAQPGGARCARNLFYDLGCSIYSSRGGQATKSLAAMSGGSGRGTSLQLFTALYQRNCIEFDSIWAWEAQHFEPSAWWRRVPASMRAKLHFYNVPVDESSPSHPASFLNLLNLTATPEDFVVVKVDIDTPSLEKKIVQTIARTPALASLVDELYFEYHFHFGGGHGPWGATQRTNQSGYNYMPDSVDDALALMRELRMAGVRSHFWI